MQTFVSNFQVLYGKDRYPICLVLFLTEPKWKRDGNAIVYGIQKKGLLYFQGME